MNFEIPSYMVMAAILVFASSQAVLIWQVKMLIDEFREYRVKLSQFQEENEARFRTIELNCVRHHSGC